MKNFLIALIVLAVLPVTAYAGGGSGGGTKKNSTLKVSNKSLNKTLGVILDKVPATPITLAAFQAAGGVLIDPSSTKTFQLKSGSHTIYAAYVDAADAPGVAGSQNVSLGKNKTVTVEVTGDEFSGPFFK